MFLHVSFLHIGLNMVTLLIVGPAVEVMVGKARFATLYLIAGLGGSVCSYLLGPAGAYGVGASGAIFGVMGAYVVLAQRNRKPMAPVVILIAINLVFGFVGSGAGVGNVDWFPLSLLYFPFSLTSHSLTSITYSFTNQSHYTTGPTLVVWSLVPSSASSSTSRAPWAHGPQRVGLVVLTSAATLGVLAALVLSIAPGHVGIS